MYSERVVSVIIPLVHTLKLTHLSGSDREQYSHACCFQVE